MDDDSNQSNLVNLFSVLGLALAAVCSLSGLAFLSGAVIIPPITPKTALPFGWHLIATAATLGFVSGLRYLPPATHRPQLTVYLSSFYLAAIVAYPNLRAPFELLLDFRTDQTWLLLLALPGLACASAFFIGAELLPRTKRDADAPQAPLPDPSDTELVELFSVPHTGQVLSEGLRGAFLGALGVAFMVYSFATAVLYERILRKVLFDGTFDGWSALGAAAVRLAEATTPLALIGLALTPLYLAYEWMRHADSMRVLQARDDAARPFSEADTKLADEGVRRLRAMIAEDKIGSGVGVLSLGLTAFLAPLGLAIAYSVAVEQLGLPGFLASFFIGNRLPSEQPFLYLDSPGVFELIMFTFMFPLAAWLSYAIMGRSNERAFKAFFTSQNVAPEDLLGRLFQILGFAIRSGQVSSPDDTDPIKLIANWYMRWQPWLTKVCLIWLTFAGAALIIDRSHYTLLTPEAVTYSRYGSFNTQTRPLTEVERLVIECRNSKSGNLMIEWRLEMPDGVRVSILSTTDQVKALSAYELDTVLAGNTFMRTQGVVVTEKETRIDFEQMVVPEHCEAGLRELFPEDKAAMLQPLFELPRP